MAYTAWSVIAGEQPTAAKWNILGTNDASFNDGTGIAGIQKNLLTTDSNPYKFLVYRNSAANAGSGAFAKISYDSEVFDTNNNFASGTYTAPVAGFYQFNWVANIVVASTDTATALYKNGASYTWSPEQFGNGAGDGGASGGSALVQAAANDTFEIYIYSSGGQALSVGSAPIKNHFSGFLVSRT